jgi:DNA repair ATPase RecN
MADAPQKLLGKLADAGEEAISKVGEMPGLNRLSNAVTGMRERLDEMQKRLRGLDEVEERLDRLEKRVNELSKPKRTRASSSKSSPTKRSSSSAT